MAPGVRSRRFAFVCSQPVCDKQAMLHEDFPIDVAQHEHVQVWTLSRPERMNSLSRDAVRALGKLARDAQQNTSVRAVILTGAGERAFCTGADLKERAGMSENDVREMLLLFRSEFGAIDASDKPFVAAINGLALGGGLELALCCDLRVMHAHAEVGLPETTLGIIPGAGGTQRLARVVGEGRAKEMVLLGRRLSAAKALAWGLVNHVVPSDANLVQSTLEWLQPIANGAPLAQQSALRALDAARDHALPAGMQLELVHYDAVLRSEDRLEALKAFAEKRKPHFRGK